MSMILSKITLNLALAMSAASSAALAVAPAAAATTHLPVPGQGWEIRFDGPEFRKVAESNEADHYKLAGNDGARFNVSFFAEPPSCAGGDSNEALLACYQQALQRNAMVVPASERANTLPKGVMVMYVIQGEVEGQKVTLLNVNVLFAHRGRWGDLHASFESPIRGDIDTLVDLDRLQSLL